MKIGLIGATLKKLTDAIANNVKEWEKLNKDAAKDPTALEPFALCLSKLPMDMLRKHVTALIQQKNAMDIFSIMVKNHRKTPGAYPNISEFVQSITALKEKEIELSKMINELQKEA
jgi:hypothetical protein